MIMVYAKINGINQFIGSFEELESLKPDVSQILEENNQIALTPYVYFATGSGTEYKLFLGGTK